jgi:hypothetical protein
MKALTLFAVLVLVGGCALPDRAFVEAVDKSWQAIGPEYRAYIEADRDLDEATKAERLGTATGLSTLIERAKKAGAQ